MRDPGPSRREKGWAPDHEEGQQRVLDGLQVGAEGAGWAADGGQRVQEGARRQECIWGKGGLGLVRVTVRIKIVIRACGL